MDKKIEPKSVLEMAKGAIAERVDYEMTRIIKNILDVNTRADKKRVLTLTLDILPDIERQNLHMTCTAKSKLEPTNPVVAALYVNHNANGDFAVTELVPQVQGQLDLGGGEQEPPFLLRLVEN